MFKAHAFDGRTWVENQGLSLHSWVEMLMKSSGRRLRANREAKQRNTREQLRGLQRGNTQPSSLPLWYSEPTHYPMADNKVSERHGSPITPKLSFFWPLPHLSRLLHTMTHPAWFKKPSILRNQRPNNHPPFYSTDYSADPTLST